MANGRVIPRRVWRNRRNSFWGRRSFVTVRFPLSLIPEPKPDFEEPPGEQSFLGDWHDERDDGTVLITRISRISGSDPRTDMEGGPTPVCVRRHGESDWFEWYEGTRQLLRKTADGYEDISCEDLSVSYVEQYIALRDWIEKYLQEFGLDEDASLMGAATPIFEALAEASFWSKTCEVQVEVRR